MQAGQKSDGKQHGVRDRIVDLRDKGKRVEAEHQLRRSPKREHAHSNADDGRPLRKLPLVPTVGYLRLIGFIARIADGLY